MYKIIRMNIKIFYAWDANPHLYDFLPRQRPPNQMWTFFHHLKVENRNCTHRHESGHMRRDKWKIVLNDKNVRVGNLHSQARSMSQIMNEWTGGCGCCTFYWEEWILPWYKMLSVSGHECCSSPRYKGQIFSFACKQTLTEPWWHQLASSSWRS